MDISLDQKISDNGFIIIKDILSKQEIFQLRKVIKNHFSSKGISAISGSTQPNAAIEIPEISWLFYHPKILNIINELLGKDKIVFTSHCDVHNNTLSGWHKDDGMMFMNGGYFEKPAYAELDCCVYKVAIYLQDHVYNQGGLTVKKGSHRFSSLDTGEELYLKTKAGDIVIFDVRLTHTGQRDVVPINSLQKPLKLAKRVTTKLGKISPQKFDNFTRKIYNHLYGERASIFFTYGANNEYTKKFAFNNMKRQILQNKNNNILLKSATRQALLDRNVALAEDYFTELLYERAN